MAETPSKVRIFCRYDSKVVGLRACIECIFLIISLDILQVRQRSYKTAKHYSAYSKFQLMEGCINYLFSTKVRKKKITLDHKKNSS